MRKFSIVLLSVLLLIVFVGCDLSVETMGKMGNNLAGTDKKYIANIRSKLWKKKSYLSAN